MMHAVLQHLGQLVQEPLLEPLRYILHNYPKLLLQASYTRCAPGGAADLFAQIQYQVQQVRTPAQQPHCEECSEALGPIMSSCASPAMLAFKSRMCSQHLQVKSLTEPVTQSICRCVHTMYLLQLYLTSLFTLQPEPALQELQAHLHCLTS